MNRNPFISKVFTSIWIKHFSLGLKIFSFDFIDVEFIKNKWFPVYINIGRNITNGMLYHLINDSSIGYKKKVFVVHDIPTYFNIDVEELGFSLKIKRINQYKGVVSNLTNYETLEAYMQDIFRAKRRSYLKRKRFLLEEDFNISYESYCGPINDDCYDKLAKNLKELIDKRFSSLKKRNSIIDFWDYYYELMKGMIENKKAVMIVVKREGKPIGMTFNFLSEKNLFFAVTTFDTDYLKYNIGHINIMATLEWCFKNNIDFFDFSKGLGEYKTKWKSTEYQYQHHILYDSDSLYASTIAIVISKYFSFKQYLRSVGINHFYSKLKYKLKHFVLQ